MKFLSLETLIKSWSVQIWALVPVLATIDYSTTWIDSIIPEEYKAVVYAALALIGLIARSIQQPNLQDSKIDKAAKDAAKAVIHEVIVERAIPEGAEVVKDVVVNEVKRRVSNKINKF